MASLLVTIKMLFFIYQSRVYEEMSFLTVFVRKVSTLHTTHSIYTTLLVLYSCAANNNSIAARINKKSEAGKDQF